MGQPMSPSRARAALDLVQAGVSVRSAAKQAGVSRTCLQRRIDAGSVDTFRAGAKTTLSSEEEDALVDCLIHASEAGLAMTRLDLTWKVAQICSDGRLVPWDEENGPGRAWVEGFFQRHHKRLAFRSSRIYEFSRVNADDPEVIASYFAWVKRVMDEHNPEDDHVHNCDESGKQQLALSRSLRAPAMCSTALASACVAELVLQVWLSCVALCVHR